MSPQEIKALLLKKRAKWVDVTEEGDGNAARLQRVRFTRPPENDFPTLLTDVDAVAGKATWVCELSHVCKYVDGWEGFTEADLIGASVGAEDPVPFSSELFAVWIEDNVLVKQKLANAILREVVDYITSRESSAKNSPPGSTPGPESSTTASSPSVTPATT